MPHCHSHTRNNNIHDLCVLLKISVLMSVNVWKNSTNTSDHPRRDCMLICLCWQKEWKENTEDINRTKKKDECRTREKKTYIISTVIINTLSKASIYQKVLQAKVMKKYNAAVLIMWYRQQRNLYCAEPAELLTWCKVDSSWCWRCWVREWKQLTA